MWRFYTTLCCVHLISGKIPGSNLEFNFKSVFLRLFFANKFQQPQKSHLSSNTKPQKKKFPKNENSIRFRFRKFYSAKQKILIALY